MQTGNFRGFEVKVHDPGIAVVTFNQPGRLNGMTHHLKRDLVNAVTSPNGRCRASRRFHWFWPSILSGGRYFWTPN